MNAEENYFHAYPPLGGHRKPLPTARPQKSTKTRARPAWPSPAHGPHLLSGRYKGYTDLTRDKWTCYRKFTPASRDGAPAWPDAMPSSPKGKVTAGHGRIGIPAVRELDLCRLCGGARNSAA